MPGSKKVRASDAKGGIRAHQGRLRIVQAAERGPKEFKVCQVWFNCSDQSKLQAFLAGDNDAIKQYIQVWPGKSDVGPAKQVGFVPGVQIKIDYQDDACADGIAGFDTVGQTIKSVLDDLVEGKFRGVIHWARAYKPTDAATKRTISLGKRGHEFPPHSSTQ